MDKISFLNTIKVEVPQLRRCCYCIPLRYGLLIWGYVKLMLALLVFLCGSIILQLYIHLLTSFRHYAMLPYALVGFALLLFLMVDVGMTIAFLIGAHQKSIKLFKVFYVYSIVLLCIVSLLFIIYNASVKSYDDDLHNYSPYQYDYDGYVALLAIEIVFGIFFMVVQIYMILLLRSEINKLSNIQNIKLTNTKADAACNMENGTSANGTYGQTNGKENENTQVTEVDLAKETDGKPFGYNKF